MSDLSEIIQVLLDRQERLVTEYVVDPLRRRANALEARVAELEQRLQDSSSVNRRLSDELGEIEAALNEVGPSTKRPAERISALAQDRAYWRLKCAEARHEVEALQKAVDERTRDHHVLLDEVLSIAGQAFPGETLTEAVRRLRSERDHALVALEAK